MATTDRKTKQGKIEPANPKPIRNTVAKQKPGLEDTGPFGPQKIQPRDQAAVTINIQSWATPIIGLVMLVIGLLGGYYIRPLTLAPTQ